MPAPPKPFSPAPSTEIHWEEPPEDGKTNRELTNSFGLIVNNHAHKMLSDLLKEHQAFCFSQQVEINSLRQQLLKCGREPNPETSCTPPIVDLEHTPKHNSSGVHKPAGKSENYFQTKVDFATSYNRIASQSDIVIWTEAAQPLESDEDITCKKKLQRFVHSDRFEMLSGAIILCNVIVMAFQVQFAGLDIGYRIPLETYSHPADEIWPGAASTFSVLDATFNFIFSIELLLRVFAFGCSSFVMPWIWFDTIIVGMGLLDFLSSGVLIGVDATFLRLVRLVRLVRLLKIFKSMVAFDTLFLLVKSIKASIHALFWSFLLLIAVQIGVALCLTQILHPSMSDTSVKPETRERLFHFFGTFPKAMMTMFEITLANWVPVCRFLIDSVHGTFLLFFVVYRCIFCFCVLRVIAAVFITETNRVLTNDAELTVMKAERDRVAFRDKFCNLLHDIDGDNDGKITWEEMQHFLANRKLVEWLSTLHLNRTDFEKLFWLLEVDQGVDIDKFLSMVGDLKGTAKTVDLLNLFKYMHAMHDDVRKGLQLDGEAEALDLQALEALEQGQDMVRDSESPGKVQ